MNKLNLSAIRTDIKDIIEPYLQSLLELHKENIVTIALYGSASGKDFSIKNSDINLIVIFKELDFPQLRDSLKLVARGMKKKITAPLFLSQRHILTSKDVFPIEFLEIKENHIILYGEDLLSTMLIDQSHTRLFCEEQIKGKLLRIRQAYLEIGLRNKGIESLMKESLYSLIPVFRALIRITGAPAPVEKEAVLKKISGIFALDEGVFIAILKDKKDDEKIDGKEVTVYFEKYIQEIKKLAIAVDKL